MATKISQAESHLKNLYAVAMADGQVAEIEEHLMIAIASRLGLSEDKLKAIRANLENIEFVLPAHYDDRVEQFQDLLMLVSVDGHIDEDEIDTCKRMAERYQLSDREFQQLIENYL